MSRIAVRACLLGVLGGGVLSVGAGELILKPNREWEAWSHTEANCAFRPVAWKAEAPVDWSSRPDATRGARSRMRADVVRHHVSRGMEQGEVLELLGKPNRIDREGQWLYQNSDSGYLVIRFTPWRTVFWAGFAFICRIGSRTTLDVGVAPPVERGPETTRRGALVAGRRTMQ